MKQKIEALDKDNSNSNLYPYRGVIRPEHILAHGVVGSPMIMLLLLDASMVRGYWPTYMRVNGIVYRRGTLQEIPSHLGKEVYAVREYQTLEAHASILKSTFDLLEYK
jgi:hypothetical protein